MFGKRLNKFKRIHLAENVAAAFYYNFGILIDSWHYPDSFVGGGERYAGKDGERESGGK